MMVQTVRAIMRKYTVTDGKLVLNLQEDEGGWYTVTSPTDPALITQAKSIREAFRMARDAMSVLRDCFMPEAGIPGSVPIRVEENGYPTGVGRSTATQAEALREMVGAVNRFRGTYGVTDYRWFDLRDHLTRDPNFQRHYGLLEDDYSPKPAFAVYRGLVRRLDHR